MQNSKIINSKTIKKTSLAPTILIAGGAGFIGSHLAEALLESNARVVVIDHITSSRKNHIEHLLSNDKFAFFEANINDGIPDIIESVDYIFHLSVLEESWYDSAVSNLEPLLTNAVGTKNLLDLANRSKAKFLLTSSVYIYDGIASSTNMDTYFGDNEWQEKKYSLAEARRFAEAMVWEYYKKNYTNIRIVRLPEIFGPNMELDSEGNVKRNIKDLLEKKDLTVFGDGDSKKHYLYIKDAVSGLLRAMLNDDTMGKVFTLIGEDKISDLELAFTLKNMADGEVKILYKPSLDVNADVERPDMDVSNLYILDWKPRVSLKDGLKRTLTFFGYAPNEHHFKPTKYIAEKIRERDQIPSISNETAKDTGVEDHNMLPPALYKVKENLAKRINEVGFKQDNQSAVETPSISDASVGNFAPQQFSFKSIPSLIKSELVALKNEMDFHLSFILGFTILVAFLAIFVGIPTLSVVNNTKSAYEHLKNVPVLVGQLDSKEAQNAAYNGMVRLNKAQKSLRNMRWMFNGTGNSAVYSASDSLCSSAIYAAQAALKIAEASEPFTTIWEVIRPDSDQIFYTEAFNNSQTSLVESKSSIKLAQDEFKHVNPELFHKSVRGQIINYGDSLDMISDKLNTVAALSADVTDILGVYKPKRYLLLFQNSNEIRPTGGFIGSYGILELNKGKISNLVIDDIYNPDGQIDLREINIVPPDPIQSFLDEDRLHLRNANWNPDFEASAQTISDLYFRVTGNTVDGVIGVDLYFVKSLLNVTGPLFLTAYNEEITSQNIYERTQYHSEFNFQPGSTQKKSFLTVLGGKMLETLFSLEKERMPTMLTEIYKSLDEKHLLVYLKDSNFSKELDNKKWSGKLVKTDNDYLYVVNANLGGTKANYYVKNNMHYAVKSLTRDGQLRGILNLKYQHTGQTNKWPNGPYTNYVRVLTPADTKLTNAKTVNNELIKDIFEDVKTDKVGEYNSFETNFTIEPGETIELTFEYDLSPKQTISKENNNYSLYWQKQPGTDQDEIEFSFDIPFGTNITGTKPTQYDLLKEKEVQYANFKNTLNTDKEFFVSFN